MWFVVLLVVVVAAIAMAELVRRRVSGRSLEREVRTHTPPPTVRVLRDEAELRRAVSRAVNREWSVAVRAARRAERMAGLAGDPALVPLGELGTGATVRQLEERSRPPEPRQLALGRASARGSGVDVTSILHARRDSTRESSESEDRTAPVA
jgi:hypothetical protein